MLEAWKDLEQEVFGPLYDEVWNSFNAKFKFFDLPPGASRPDTEPSPSVTYSVKAIYAHESEFDRLTNDLHRKAIAAFRQCVPVGEALYVLDWQHPAHLLYPHVPFNIEDPLEWRVPVFPYGDYYIFIARDFSFGTIGHPWEETICVFGEQLIGEFEKDLPLAFEELRRK